jgi:UDP-2-acetamido-2-deoxy-ribo-hexuluronate aminotransferase
MAASAEIRDRALVALEDLAVDARSYYAPPLHRHPHFKNADRTGSLPVTEDACRRIVSVPVHPYMEERAAEAVIAGLIRGAKS